MFSVASCAFGLMFGRRLVESGYETHMDLMAAGISEEDVAHFDLRPKTKAMIVEQIARGGRVD